MPIVEKVTGDILALGDTGNYRVLVQGCNCFCTQRSGLAAQVSRKYPRAVEADNATVRGDLSKLGQYTYSAEPSVIVINAYTQYRFGRERIHVSYSAVRDVFRLLNADFGGSKALIPKIGCGEAGGDWGVVETIINNVTPDLEITAVLWDKEPHPLNGV